MVGTQPSGPSPASRLQGWAPAAARCSLGPGKLTFACMICDHTSFSNTLNSSIFRSNDDLMSAIFDHRYGT